MAKRQKSMLGYPQGYCDGWMSAVERMANVAGLGEQANVVYRALWEHWETRLLPWMERGNVQASPPVPFPDWPTYDAE